MRRVLSYFLGCSRAVKSRKSLAPELLLRDKSGQWVFVVFRYQERLIWPTPEVIRVEAHVAQLAERVLGKDEVISSILIMGSRLNIKAQKPDIITPGASNG